MKVPRSTYNSATPIHPPLAAHASDKDRMRMIAAVTHLSNLSSKTVRAWQKYYYNIPSIFILSRVTIIAGLLICLYYNWLSPHTGWRCTLSCGRTQESSGAGWKTRARVCGSHDRAHTKEGFFINNSQSDNICPSDSSHAFSSSAYTIYTGIRFSKQSKKKDHKHSQTCFCKCMPMTVALASVMIITSCLWSHATGWRFRCRECCVWICPHHPILCKTV